MLKPKSIEVLGSNMNNQSISKNSFRQICNNLEIPELTNEQKIFSTSENYDVSFLDNNIKNKLVLEIIHDAILKSETITDFNILHNNILELKKTSNATLIGTDLDIALIFLEVLDNSALFWLSKSANGSGEGELIINQINSTKTYYSKNPNTTLTTLAGPGRGTKILASDAAGAAGVFVSYGLLAGLTGPMGIGALCATVAVGAAWSSGCSALGI